MTPLRPILLQPGRLYNRVTTRSTAPSTELPHDSLAQAQTNSLSSSRIRHPFTASLLFAGERKIAPNARATDSYVHYTPYNTACPLATWHTFAKSKAMAYHSKNAEVLDAYIKGTGEYYQDIAWIKHGKAIGEEPYTVFDTETTGLENYDRIVQIAASLVEKNHQVQHATDYNTYVNPGQDAHGKPFEIKSGASEVHGITADDVVGKPTMEELLLNFRNNILKRNGLVVAYNAKFDIHYLNNAINKWNRSPHRREHGFLRPLEPALVLDPYVLIQRIHPFVSLRKRLGDQYEILMGRPLENKHDAQADVDGTVDLLKYIVKYLEKHTIPVEWAAFIDKKLPQKEWTPSEKAAVIARIVRQNRAIFEQKMPVKPEPLKITDVLKFQHGAPVYHDDSGLPKLDISLNIFGWDGSKVWEDQSDTLDPAIVHAVRTERDGENRAFIRFRLAEKLGTAPIQELMATVKPALKQSSKMKSLSKTEANLQKRILDDIGNLFAERLLTKTLPTSDKGWKSVEKEVGQQIQSLLKTTLKNNVVPPKAAITPLVKASVEAMKHVQKALGERFFYAAVPIDPEKPLIDPAVLQLVLKKSTRKKG